MKRIICLLVIIVMLVSLSFVGCSKTDPTKETTASAPATTVSETFDPFGKYEPPINMTAVNTLINTSNKFLPGESPSNNIWIKTYEEELGIKVNVLWADTKQEKLSLMITSGDLPDLFALPGSGPMYDQLVEQGLIADLTDVYEKYASPLVKDLMTRDGGRSLEASKRNGKMYSIPRWSDPIDEASLLWVREDWRLKLNLPKPKTMDDLVAIAEAFVTKDPDGNGKADTLGLYVSGDGTQPFGFNYTLGQIFNGFHAYPSTWVKDASGKLVYGKTQIDVMKPALKFLQDLYKKNLISKEFATNQGATLQEDTVQEKYGMFFGAYWSSDWPLRFLKMEKPDSEWEAYPIVSADDKPAMIPVPGVNIYQHYVVNKNCEHPEAVIKMLNLSSEKLHGKTADFDKYGVDPNDGSRYMWKYTVVQQLLPRQEDNKYVHINQTIKSGDASALTALEKLEYVKIVDYMEKGTLDNWPTYKMYGPGGSIRLYLEYEAEGRFLYDEFFGTATPSMIEYKDGLDIRFNDVLVKTILGADVNEYDKFVEEWYKLGGEKMTTEANEWYSANKK